LAWRGMLRLCEIVLISLVLQIGFAAFSVVYFHRASIESVAANAVLVPAAGLLIPAAWIGMLLLGCGGLLARVSSALTVGLAHAMLRTAAAMAHGPLAQWRPPSPPGWMLVAVGAASAIMAALAAVLAWAPFPPRLPPGLSATILDVGQGDSIFVTFPDR